MDYGLRASDADRNRAAAQLQAHFAAGRLTLSELDDRLTVALRAVTIGDLRRALADLPEPAPRRNGSLERGYRRTQPAATHQLCAGLDFAECCSWRDAHRGLNRGQPPGTGSCRSGGPAGHVAARPAKPGSDPQCGRRPHHADQRTGGDPSPGSERHERCRSQLRCPRQRQEHPRRENPPHSLSTPSLLDARERAGPGLSYPGTSLPDDVLDTGGLGACAAP
jgi:hypothetical protein